MKRRSISLIIGLMSFALLGVVAMQYYFLKESYTLKSQLFDQAVNDALKNVSFKLEKHEAAAFLFQRASAEKKANAENRLREQQKIARNARKRINPKEDPSIAFIRKLKADQAKSDSIFKLRDSLLRNRYPNILVYNGPVQDDPQETVTGVRYDFEEITDEFGVRQNIVKQVFTDSPKPKKHRIKRGSAVIDSIRQYVIVDPVLGPVVKTIGKPNYLSNISAKELAAATKYDTPQKQQAKNVKLFLDSVEKNNSKKELLDNIASEFQQVNIPLMNRIKPHIIDSLLLIELANNGIFLNYNYKISSNRNTVLFRNASNLSQEFEPENTYKAVLFPKDMVRESGFLVVNFPEKNSLILSNMNTIMASSVGLLFILVGSFAYTIFSILRQKKVTEMKNDFINNMTHEFKTPVATIMIASEALRDPEVNDDIKRVNKLAGIIYDENVRLGNHIERVLNIARIEKDDLKIESNPIDINDLISAVTDSMSLQLQKNKASVKLNLDAEKAVIMGDELHFSNMIFNLLDNAIKYSIKDPEIIINTFNRSSDLIITVSDNGIGMNRDQQKKIFEQFYRIPTGNLHDVKGFGLGLSYVNKMVKRMDGEITVRSEKDKGSEFELKFHTV